MIPIHHCLAIAGIILSLSLPGMLQAAERHISIYGGRYSDDHADEILANKPIHFKDSRIGVLALSKVMSYTGPSTQWEAEAQLGRHFRQQDHWEFNVLAIYRWRRFPWDHLLTTTMAVGDGLSYATEVPPLELSSHSNRGAARLLNYVMLEVTFAPPQANNWSLMMRMHHRSGVFGLFSNVYGGSNIVAAGVRIRY